MSSTTDAAPGQPGGLCPIGPNDGRSNLTSLGKFKGRSLKTAKSSWVLREAIIHAILGMF